MTDEEKKAIDVIKSLGISIHNGKSQIIPGDTTKEISTAIYTIINLIEKQSNEIEELKKYENGYNLLLYSLDNYISKDKIKSKIEELKEDIKYTANPLSIDNSKSGIKVLQSLLKEEE